jgi:hypothetical protein
MENENQMSYTETLAFNAAANAIRIAQCLPEGRFNNLSLQQNPQRRLAAPLNRCRSRSGGGVFTGKPAGVAFVVKSGAVGRVSITCPSSGHSTSVGTWVAFEMRGFYRIRNRPSPPPRLASVPQHQSSCTQ